MSITQTSCPSECHWEPTCCQISPSVICPHPPQSISSTWNSQTTKLLSTQESWYLWNSIAIFFFLPGRSFISDNLEGIDICSKQTLHWCPTRFCTWSSSFLTLYSISWQSYALLMSGRHFIMDVDSSAETQHQQNQMAGHPRRFIPMPGSCNLHGQLTDLPFDHRSQSMVLFLKYLNNHLCY